jgi:hypothetical protein
MQLGGHADFLRPFIWSLASGLMPFLTADQKQQCVNVCKELCQIACDDAVFLSRVITGDECCIYGYDIQTKQQSSEWKSPNLLRLKKGETDEDHSQECAHYFLLYQRGLHTKNSSWQAKGSISHTTVIFYSQCMKMCEDFALNYDDKITYLLQQDNAPSHSSIFTKEFFSKNNMAVIPH